jgi:hypothetical protein
MRAPTFFLATEASEANGFFNVTGGGGNLVRVSSFPAPLLLKAVIEVDFAPEEIDLDPRLRVQLRDALGETLPYVHNLELPALELPALKETPLASGHAIFHWVASLANCRIPAAGPYRVVLMAGDEELTFVEMRVELGPPPHDEDQLASGSAGSGWTVQDRDRATWTGARSGERVTPAD